MSAAIPALKTIQITLSKGVAVISHNRPERYNTLSPLVYSEWLDAVRWAANCDEAKVTVITGKGKYYTSGQELIPPPPPKAGETMRDVLTKQCENTKNLIAEMIRFPKLLIGAVNGNAIGFGVTTLALCDVVYAVPGATFKTPFMQLAFCAEGCSSVLFPRIMGYAKANEMLLMGTEYTSEDFLQSGFISRIIPADKFHDTVFDLAAQAAQLPLNAMRLTKALVRDVDRELLERVNEAEMTLLIDRMLSDESMEAVMQFVANQQKRKSQKNSKL
ncbi:ClpP/crotonase-like domain-containing protein [Jimgerdemannia flammicorona]|uniref:ClpP/crotonase-like domain-containing protein n=1 Tax=Jimgerdemannia flammicorona TaxID=994334 RepID=A0A433Q9R5_9FUNG|nr:ClpP/crotonase-like domain-containing protein [Jimgerdemannia flammicorona]